MAQAALGKDNSVWQKIRTDLVNFGKLSGLFTDINVHRFGKKDIDPFEIMVNVHGMARNLVDVGYGVSQILPIVYQLSDPDTYGAYLLQQPEVHLHPRAQAALGSLIVQAVARAKRRPYVLIETHSDYLADLMTPLIFDWKITWTSLAVTLQRAAC
ncbi:MAG: AAA family ATPase, partial [Acetobacteraceae bacterium]